MFMILESDQGKKYYDSCYATSCMQFLKSKYFRCLYRRAGLMAQLVEFGPVKRQPSFLFHEVY